MSALVTTRWAAEAVATAAWDTLRGVDAVAASAATGDASTTVVEIAARAFVNLIP